MASGYEAVREAKLQAKAEFADIRAIMIQRAIAAATARLALNATPQDGKGGEEW